MALAALVALALALRLVVLRGVGVIETDGVRYIAIARQFKESGNPFDPLFHPLYPMALALAQPLVGDWELAGRLVAAASGALLLLPAWALARDVLGRAVATLTAALLAVHPALVRNSASVLADSTYALLLACGVWLAWRAIAGAHGALFPAAAAVLAAAYLVRPEAAIYFVAALGVALVLAIRDRTLVVYGPWIAGALAAFAVVAAPYVLFLRRSLGHWTLSGKVAHNLVLDLGPAAGVAPLAHPGLLLAHTAQNALAFVKYALPELLPSLLILFFLPGLLSRARGDGWAGREGVLLAAALPAFGTLAFHTEARVFLPVLAFVLPFVAAGVLATAGWLAGGQSLGRWSAGLATGVLLLLLPVALRPILRPDPAGAVYRQAARLVAETQPRDAVVLDRKPFVAFYSGRRHAPLGAEVSPADLQAVARRAGARLVVLDSHSLEDRPRLAPLVWSAPPPGFDVVRDFDTGPTGRLRVLKPSDRG